MVGTALEYFGVPNGNHEVVGEVHVDEEMEESRVHEHRGELGVVDITSWCVPQLVPYFWQEHTTHVNSDIRTDEFIAELGDWILRLPPLGSYFCWRWGSAGS